jgi:hypothetical protein
MGLSPNLNNKIGRQNIPKGKELFPMGGKTKVMAYHAKNQHGASKWKQRQ